MGGVQQARSARRFRRARRLRSQRRGVVAVIGTLLALLVFFALFGIFLTQYVPLWMNDNESAFTSGAQASFAQLKSDIDTQYILDAPPTLGVPFGISSAGIPLIAQATQGTLNFLPQNCPAGFYSKVSTSNPALWGQPMVPSFCIFENQSLSIGPGGYKNYSMNVQMGVLQMVLPNRYFPPQTLDFEADGVIQVQTGSYQLMAYAPPLNITRLAGNTTITGSFLQLYGNASTVVGQGTQEVYSHLRFAQHLFSNGYNTLSRTFRPLNYTFEVGTQFPCAWSRFLSHQLNASGLTSTVAAWPSPYYIFSPYTGSCTDTSGATTTVQMEVVAATYVSLYYAGVQVTTGIGST